MAKSTSVHTTVSQVTGDERDRSSGESSPSHAWERRALEHLLRIFGNPAIRIRLWDGEEIVPSGKRPVATFVVKERSTLYRLLAKRDVAFGDEFSAGRVLVEGDLIDLIAEIDTAGNRSGHRSAVSDSLYRMMTRRPRRNTVDGSRENIHHHYDIGNEFYRLWLDEEMQYTCAYFPQRDISIEQAQQAKMHHVCRKLQLKPGDRVVEAGCGWGSLARHMALHYGAKVRAFNISREQVAFARERAAREGFTDRVEYVLDDYRNVNGEYDVFVSVGMLEHVGKPQYRVLGSVIDRCLTSTGRALIHTIGRNCPRLMNAWIEKRIFPGAYPPTLREMMDIVEPHNFSVLDVENLRLHYAVTLEQWLERFDAAEAKITEMFDERFFRAWQLYLAGSVAAFRTSSLQLFQMVIARGEDNTVPWTREHVYDVGP